MYVIDNGIIQGPGGEVLGITHVEADRRKLGGSSLVNSLGEKVGTVSGSSDGFSVYNGSGKL